MLFLKTFLFICFNTKKYTGYDIHLNARWNIQYCCETESEVFRQVSRQTTSSFFSLFILSITTFFRYKQDRIWDLRQQILVQDCPKCFGMTVTRVLSQHDEVLPGPIRHTQCQFSQSVSSTSLFFYFFFSMGPPGGFWDPVHFVHFSIPQENSQNCPKPQKSVILFKGNGAFHLFACCYNRCKMHQRVRKEVRKID